MDGRRIITLLKHTACWNLHLSEWIFIQHLVLSFIWWATLLSLIADYVFLMPEYYKSSTHWTGVLPALNLCAVVFANVHLLLNMLSVIHPRPESAAKSQTLPVRVRDKWPALIDVFFKIVFTFIFIFSEIFIMVNFIKYFVTIYYFIMVATSIKLNFLQLCQLHMKFLHFRLACSLSLWQVHMHWKVTTSVNFPVMTSLTWSCLPQRTWIFCFPPTWALSWFSSWWFWPSSWFWWQLSVHRLLLCPLYRNGSFDLLSHFCCTALYWSL